MSSRTCYLKCVIDPEKVINLPHLEPVILGRNEDTGITDPHVSRNHMELLANHDNEKITLKTLGKCHAGCNGYALIKNSEYSVKNGDRIEIRLGFHQYDVVFEGAKENNQSPPINKKRKLEIMEDDAADLKFVNSGKWEDFDNKELLIYTLENCKARPTIAAFDLDGTLVKTKSGARFPKDSHDWEWNFGNVTTKVQELFKNHNKIVVFTNQSGLGKDSNKIKNFKEKIENVAAKMATPMQVFIATGKSVYRKPSPGMWRFLKSNKNDGVGIDVDRSFFVGDAAGRDKNWAPKKNKDHSTADRLFALNLGLKFYTPEEYFLKASKISFKMPEFDPRLPLSGSYPKIEPTKHEVIVMVGAPGSGKSHFCKSQLIPKGYVRISRDELGSWQRCVKKLSDCVKQKQSVVIDNTNPDAESRQRFLDVAKSQGVDCRCFVMTTTIKHAKHNNKFRELTDKTHQTVSEIIINAYNKNYQEPKLSEGFSEIIQIPFIPKFNHPDDEKMYQTFLLES